MMVATSTTRQRRARRAAAVALALLPALAASCGGDDRSAAVRTIEVVMSDNAFEPASLTVELGESVRVAFVNRGVMVHEAVLGDAVAQDAHHASMTSSGTHVHSGQDGVTVAPGDEVEVDYTFDQPGPTIIGCHQPGHWEAGMRLDVLVVEPGRVAE